MKMNKNNKNFQHTQLQDLAIIAYVITLLLILAKEVWLTLVLGADNQDLNNKRFNKQLKRVLSKIPKINKNFKDVCWPKNQGSLKVVKNDKIRLQVV